MGGLLCSSTRPFKPPTNAPLIPIELPLWNEDFRKLVLHVKITFLGNGILRLSAPTARVAGYGGDEEYIDFVGVWYDLEKRKREHADERRRQEETEAKYESCLKKTDGLKPWNDF
ncbi:hypothetical protein KCU85_g4810, partial [Aureobasidium melanogenum]